MQRRTVLVTGRAGRFLNRALRNGRAAGLVTVTAVDGRNLDCGIPLVPRRLNAARTVAPRR
jgi:hypothetical protein